MILEPYTIPKLLMIQAPSGTGKSRTITGIIQQVFLEASIENGSNELIARPKILLCAPSDDAIDRITYHLITHLMQEKDSPMLLLLKSSSGDTQSRFSLDYHIVNYFQKDEKNDGSKNCKVNICGPDVKIKKGKKTKAEGDISEQTKPVANIMDEINLQEKNKLQSKIFNDADLVVCTINSKDECILKQHWKNANLNLRKFTCVIIDEAATYTELDSLVPLLYCDNKLIMIGDPKQLPYKQLPKYVSCNANRSLMERFCQYFEDDTKWLLLDTQYSIHPEICYFPSNHFYGAKLNANISSDKNFIWFPLRPYLVLDLANNIQESSNILNLGPALNASKFTIDMCNHLLEHIFSRQIGIITLYKEQTEILRYRLSDRADITVDTLDAFQGKKKDVIILLCIQSNVETENISFLNNPKAMNTALNCAKYSLFIIGRLSSLKVNSDWQALIDDAAQRKVIVNIKSRNDLHNLHRKLLKGGLVK